MNIVKLQNDLKDLSDQQLLSTMQTGSSPQYLVLAEMQRRKKMREEAATPNEPQAQGTVADEIMGGIASIPMGSMDMASGGLVSFAKGGEISGYAKGAAEACWKNPETGETECPSGKPDIRKPTVKKMQEGGVLRLLPADPVADAYTYLQSRGAEIPTDMSEQGIIEYANRVRALDENEVKDAGVNVPAEAAPAARPSWPALYRDYGSGGRGEVMPETRLDTAPQMPMGGGEMAPGFSPVAPTQEGLPGLLAPEGPAPERAVPFLGQVMENIVPSAQAAEPAHSFSAEEGLQRMFAAEKAAAAGEPEVQAPMAEPTWYEEVGDWIYENPTEAAITALSLVPVVGVGGRIAYVTAKAAPKFIQSGWRAAEKGFRQRYAQKGANKGKEAIEEGTKAGKPYKSKEWAENEAKRRGGAAMKDPNGEGWIVVPKMSEAAKGFVTSGEGAGITAGLGLTAASLVGDDEEAPPATTTPPATITPPTPSGQDGARDDENVPPGGGLEDLGKELTGREAYFDYLLKRRKGLEGREKDAANQALMAMGLSMMASKNPDFLGALGEGGIKGLEQYSKAEKEREEQILDLLKEEGDIYAAESMYGTRQGQLSVSAYDKAAKMLESQYTGLGRTQIVAALKAKYPNATPEDINQAVQAQYLRAVQELAATMQGTGMGVGAGGGMAAPTQNYADMYGVGNVQVQR